MFTLQLKKLQVSATQTAQEKRVESRMVDLWFDPKPFHT